jgi:hypothetical protein
VPYRATVILGDVRASVDVLVDGAAARAERAEGGIKLRILREINEMPAGRDWVAYLKELEPIELSRREV